MREITKSSTFFKKKNAILFVLLCLLCANPVSATTEPDASETVQEEKIECKNEALDLITKSDIDYYTAGIDEADEPVELEGKEIHNIKIEGLKTVSSETVLACIKNKSGSLYSEELLQQDLQRVYSSGYFTDNIAINPILNEDNSVDLVFELHENLIVNDVQIWGNTVISTNELYAFAEPLKGLPQNINNINAAIDKITDYYHRNGYILAGVNSVDDEDGVLKLYISEGVINSITLSGNKKTKDFVINRNILTQPGTVYNEECFKEDLSRIYETKLFKDIDRQITPVKDGEKGEYDIKIVVKEASSNSVAVGAGVDNALGIFGSLSISENNFLGRGQRVSLSGLLGSGILLSDSSITDRANYQLELNFFEPYFLNADNSLASKLYYRDLGSYQVPLAIERRFGLMANVEHKVRNYKGLTTNLGVGFEHISLKEGDFNKIASLYSYNHLNIADRAKELTGGMFFNIAPGLKYSTIDTTENPREGIVAQAKFTEAVGMSHFKNTNGRLLAGVTKYFPVAKKSSLAITARGGLKVHGDDMPEIMAFGLGGPYSIRGFRMNGVGMGNGFIMGSAELATPLPFVDRLKFDFFKKIRLTFFVDTGHVYDGTISSILYDRPMSAITAGIGLKVYIPNVGPVSIDYGVPLTNPGDYGSKSGYFTFGTGCLDMYNY